MTSPRLIAGNQRARSSPRRDRADQQLSSVECLKPRAAGKAAGGPNSPVANTHDESTLPKEPGARPQWLRYVIALIALFLATCGCLLFDPFLAGHPYYLWFVCGLLIVFWYGDVGPALLFLCVSPLALAFFVLDPPFDIRVESPSDQVGLMLYGITALILFSKSARDTTLQKRGQSALRDAEDRYHSMFESNHHLVQSVSANGRFLIVNPAWLTALGYSQAELAGLRFEDVVHPDGQSFCRELFSRIRSGEVLKTVDAQFQTKEGRLIAVEGNVTGRFLRGDLVEIHGFFQDVTDRKRAELDLRASEARLRQIIDLVPHSIFAKDRHGKFLLANEALAKDFGTTVESLVGQNHQAIHPNKEELAKMLSDDLEVIQTGKPKFIPEEYFTDAAGHRRFKQTTKIPFTESGTNEPAILGVATDITELRKAQEGLIQSERLAAIGQMMASLVHESRNSLGIIQIAVELLRARVAQSDEDCQPLERIQNAVDEIVRLFDEIRQYASPLKLDLSTCSVADIWREAWSRLEEEWSSRAVNLVQQIGGLRLECRIDRLRWVQVFRNIFENSLAACKDPTCIEIVCAEEVEGDGKSLRISILDNGPGLSEEQCLRVFDAFYTTKAKGTGLGMAIVKRIVEAHGGTIVANSRLGQGAEFTITLPI